MSKLNDFKCLNCDSTEGSDYKGFLGYEAGVCDKCGSHHTWDGTWDKEGNMVADYNGEKCFISHEIIEKIGNINNLKKLINDNNLTEKPVDFVHIPKIYKDGYIVVDVDYDNPRAIEEDLHFTFEQLGINDYKSTNVEASEPTIKADEETEQAQIETSDSNAVEQFKQKYSKPWELFDGNETEGYSDMVKVLATILKGGKKALWEFQDGVLENNMDYIWQVADSTVEEFKKENSELTITPDDEEQMRHHIESLASMNISKLFNFPVLVKHYMAEMYNESGVVS